MIKLQGTQDKKVGMKMKVIKIAICDDIKRKPDLGEILRMRRKLSQMFEEIQKAYMDFCRKEALK